MSRNRAHRWIGRIGAGLVLAAHAAVVAGCAVAAGAAAGAGAGYVAGTEAKTNP